MVERLTFLGHDSTSLAHTLVAAEVYCHDCPLSASIPDLPVRCRREFDHDSWFFSVRFVDHVRREFDAELVSFERGRTTR